MSKNDRPTPASPRLDDPRPYLMQLPLRIRLTKANRILERLDEYTATVREVRNTTVADLSTLGFTYAEIGDLLGVSVTRIKQLIDAEPRQEAAESCHDFPDDRPQLATLVGDNPPTGSLPVAPYRGSTTGTVASPVFFNPHTALRRNRPPAIAIVGAPGAGKSVLAQSILSTPGSPDVTSVVLDPKGDYTDLHPTWRQVNVTKDNLSGILDPFRFAATDVILNVLRRLHHEPFSEAMENVLLDGIITEHRHSTPTMSTFAERLRASANREASAFGQTLTQQVAAIPGADVIFGSYDSGASPLITAGGVTVLRQSIHRITDPAMPAADPSLSTRFASAVTVLLLAHVEHALRQLPTAAPKLLVIEEATLFPPADIARLARLGRSHHLALILMNQNPDHITTNPLLRNIIGTTFAFRLTPHHDADAMTELLQAPHTLTTALTSLRQGECFLSDADGRLQRIQITPPQNYHPPGR